MSGKGLCPGNVSRGRGTFYAPGTAVTLDAWVRLTDRTQQKMYG